MAKKQKNKDKRKSYPKGFWKKFKENFQRSPADMALAEFCRIHNVPLSTAKYHGIKKSDKPDDLLADAIEAEQEFLKRLKKEGAADHRAYLNALKRASMVLGDITEKAASDYIYLSTNKRDYNSPAEAGRLAINAAKSAVDIAVEVEGVPDEEETFGWPLTKGFRPLPYQRDFIFDSPSVLSEYGEDKFIFAFIAGIGSGKTRCGAEKLGDIAWQNRGTVLGVFAPTYRMLEDATKKMFLDVLANKGISYRHRKTDNAIILFGDTKILFRSMDNPEHLRGPNLTAAWIDEGGQVPKKDAFDVIYGRVRKSDDDTTVDKESLEMMIWITTTPKGLNWLYDVCVEDQEKNKVQLYGASTRDNITLNPDYYDRCLGIYDKKMAQQELEGKFLNIFTGQMYSEFSRGRNVILGKNMPFEYNPNYPIHLTCDFNVSPMCWNVIVNYKETDYIIDEIHMDSTRTQHAIDEFIRRYRNQKATIYVYGDAAHGTHRQTSASRTDFQIISDALSKGKNKFKKKFPEVIIRVGKQNPAIIDRVAGVNARLRNAVGQSQLFFLKERTKYSIMDMEKCGFIPGTRQPDESDKTIGHHAAAIGYYAYWHYPIFGMRVKKGRKR